MSKNKKSQNKKRQNQREHHQMSLAESVESTGFYNKKKDKSVCCVFIKKKKDSMW